MRKGCWDVDERIKDMNAGGLLGSLCFPSMPGFSGRIFASAKDDDIADRDGEGVQRLARPRVVRQAPRPVHPARRADDLEREETAKEVHRLADMGCHAITFPENPAPLDAPTLHDPYWDPFWRAAEERGTVICMHIGSSSKLAMTTPDAPIDVLITLQPMNIVQAAADLVWSRVLKEFPDIKIALSEGGIGWVPYFLDRIERTYDMHHHWTGQDLGDLTPTERFLKNVLLCFISDPVGLQLVDRIGSQNVELGDGLPALRFVVAHRARGPRPRHHRGRPQRRRHQEHHASHGHALVRLRPVPAHRPRGRRPSRRCASRPRATTSRSARWVGAASSPKRSTSPSCRRRATGR